MISPRGPGSAAGGFNHPSTPLSRRIFRLSKTRRKWLWRQLPCFLVLVLYAISLSFVRVVQPAPPIDAYAPVRASNGLFVTVSAYIIDGDAEERVKGPFTASEDEFLLVFLGIGEFGTVAQVASDENKGIPPKIPANLTCGLMADNNQFKGFGSAHAHVTGTAFEGSISPSRGSVRYFGERALMLSCVVPKRILHELYLGFERGMLPDSGESARFPVKIVGTGFDAGVMVPKFYLSQKVPVRDREKSVLCSSPIYGLSGTRWLTEWLFYHHFVQGFDDIHLYFTQDVGVKTMKTIAYLAELYPWVTAHNWSSVLNGQENGLDPMNGVGNGVVKSEGYERAQRLVRTDCYLRNRGRKWIGILDMDEFFYSAPSVNFKKDIVEATCSKANVCRFSSVTVYPVKNTTIESKMFFDTLLPTCEAKCVQGFNCGTFNYGREKYLVQASRDVPNPGTVLAIHTVSDSQPFTNSFGHILVPKTMGFVKHFNPRPYAKTGGYPTGTECAYPPQAARAMLNAIESDSTLKQLYDRDMDEEQFLKLEKADDPWRFASS